MTLPPEAPNCEFLFTYGTLQPGRAPGEIAAVIGKLQIAGKGYVHGTLYDFGHYPGAVLNSASADSSRGQRIAGTIYRLPLDPELLRQLDEYEEYFPESPATSQFLREIHAVYREDGNTIPCWVYVLNMRRKPGSELN